MVIVGEKEKRARPPRRAIPLPIVEVDNTKVTSVFFLYFDHTPPGGGTSNLQPATEMNYFNYFTEIEDRFQQRRGSCSCSPRSTGR